MFYLHAQLALKEETKKLSPGGTTVKTIFKNAAWPSLPIRLRRARPAQIATKGEDEAKN